MGLTENKPDIAEQETLPLPLVAIQSAADFQAYLIRYHLSPLQVSQACGVRLLTVWNLQQGNPIRTSQAELVRRGLYRLTGIPYVKEIVVHSSAGKRPGTTLEKQGKENKSMSGPQRQQNNELASTYLVFDPRYVKQELKRLIIQDHLITTSMGGVLPEQEDPTRFQSVLDLGCGTGGWLIETAKVYPSISRLVGVDISNTMVTFARNQANICSVEDRVSFAVMDALRLLKFPDATFDLVNLRFGCSYVRTWEWPQVISEMLRVCRPGGIIRFTEPAIIQQSSSAALLQFCSLLQGALFRAGYLFEQAPTGLTARLTRLLAHYGVKPIHAKDSALQYQAGAKEGRAFVEDVTAAFQTLRPFLGRWERLPREYDAICQQALLDMQQPDFQVTWNLLTVWGEPARSIPFPTR
jgi:ubiquinone/menaquinone biosynthesis C-methylase UbiE